MQHRARTTAMKRVDLYMIVGGRVANNYVCYGSLIIRQLSLFLHALCSSVSSCVEEKVHTILHVKLFVYEVAYHVRRGEIS